jgi:hypothetical protein
MLDFLPAWAQSIIALAILGLGVVLASRVTGMITKKVV